MSFEAHKTGDKSTTLAKGYKYSSTLTNSEHDWQSHGIRDVNDDVLDPRYAGQALAPIPNIRVYMSVYRTISTIMDGFPSFLIYSLVYLVLFDLPCLQTKPSIIVPSRW